MKIIFFITALLLSVLAQSYEVREAASSLWIDCSVVQTETNSCQKLCKANQCKIAELTCEGCARASDMMFVSILKRFHRIYDTNEVTHSPDSLKPWIAKSFFVAIGANSPLNIFADPFSEDDTAELARAFDKVCGSKGNHYVLAQQADVLKPQGIICQTDSGWKIQSLKYRADYYSNRAQQGPYSITQSQRP